MPRKGFESVVLVTGFPTFVAKKLVLFLLFSEPHTQIVTIVLPKLVVEARRIIDSLDPHDRERIVVYKGDVAAIDLGLSGMELRKLAPEVDRIHHIAHASYVGVDRETAQSLNVVGAHEIVSVAKLMTNLSCLVHHSTAFVAGGRRGTVFEEDPSDGGSHRNIIEQTRASAESIVRRAQKRLPIATIRPTMIVGDSGTGEVDRLDLPYLFVLFLMAAPENLTLPLRSQRATPLHLVPVDFVVRAAAAIGKDPKAPGRTFHLADPSPLTVGGFIEKIQEIRNQRFSKMDLPTLARSVFNAPGIEGYLKSPKSFVEQLLTHVRFDTTNADALLSPLGIECPPFEQYADKVVSVVEERLIGQTLRPPFEPPQEERTTSVLATPAPAPAEPSSSHDTDAMD